MKDGRFPEGTSTRIGFWKAEEIQKFAYPPSQLVFDGVLSNEEYDLWLAAVRIFECLFGFGRNGMMPEMLSTLKPLIWIHNIFTEEVHGGKSCVISLHNLIHLTDNIRRFYCPENYLCCTFERAVHTYVERSSNKKHMELTFTKAVSRRELLKLLIENASY